MKTLLQRTILPVWLVMSFSATAQYITPEEAVFLANKHIRYEIDRYGQWNGNTTIRIDTVHDLFCKGQKIGYYSNIQPTGFIILNLRKEFHAVKAFSDHGFLNAADTFGLVDLVSSRMALYVNTVEDRFGPITHATVGQVESLLEVSGRGGCDFLTGYIPGSVTDMPLVTGNYDEGEVLLTTNWHQEDPYNNDCPFNNCSTTTNGNALVGCVATAGVQVMRYWAWPLANYLNPQDPYQWWDMRNEVSTYSPAAQQAAVAELSSDIGLEVGMDYGCAESASAFEDMEDVFEQNFYNTSCDIYYRDDYEYDVWWLLIKMQLDLNNPMPYGIRDGDGGHAIVCDGWQEIEHYGYPPYHYYHMNYGWNLVSDDCWYLQDMLPGSYIIEDFFFANTVPINATGPTLVGIYASGFHYVNMMASGSAAIFPAGSLIQTLARMSVTGTGSAAGVRVDGTAANPSKMYTNGSPDVGIRINAGSLLLKNSGSVKFYLPDDNIPYYPPPPE